MGSWIGGDRDGNPFVNAEVLRQAIEMQSKRVVDFYLDESASARAELSLDRARVSISAQLRSWSARLPDDSPRRAASRTGRPSSASMRGWSRPRADWVRSCCRATR
jgi:phosphoenolpyruvate carboxylase